MNRSGKALIVAATVTLALAGCGAAAPEKAAAPDTPVASDVAAEAVALQEVGFTTDDDPSPGATGKDAVRPRVVRKLLRRNALHGEVTVRVKDGTKTIVVQRGKVTAVTGQSLTVQSTDGFELTWSYGDPLRIVRKREEVKRDVLTTGVQVGIGGVRDGDATDARLIVVK
ncbi:hypothetical protein GCM10010168_75130 [Actinoplanes ianthinogenes]|uniref:DUF5666 domain-containing protein n=1 Tax=Actinoplanes ianthinogenes TaxID=122358 RepID=A0ABN6C8U0_9ACTN|nr:hypothetical protein [Actinoplanes ianthinogenes]BCJ41825.1 hypothetical protein Aiant_24820 [Actinoplanes ianthinogenes]GGR45371.1 hypothetical protein GCM10010168_75130 [Actinoplanes ianthinogenes]